MKIDIHAHYTPESCLESQEGVREPGNLVGAMTDLGKRLQDMDNQGVDVQAISPWPGLLNRDLAMARRFNDGTTEAVNRHPTRLVGLASVPMDSPTEAVAELERAVKELGMRGVEIGSNVKGVNLDAKEFAPFYAKVQELDVPVFIHPVEPLGVDRLQSYYLSNILGFPTDTAVAAASLIFGGVLKEFPRLKICLAHGGGTSPFLIGRWEHGWRVRKEPKAVIQRPPSEYFNLLYFDFITHSAPALSYLVENVGAEKVVLGTDYPFDMGKYDGVEFIAALPGLSDDQREMIYGRNTAALLKLDM